MFSAAKPSAGDGGGGGVVDSAALGWCHTLTDGPPTPRQGKQRETSARHTQGGGGRVYEEERATHTRTEGERETWQPATEGRTRGERGGRIRRERGATITDGLGEM